jgi:KDO2-lipid IV(A) lauroyltransferase
MSIEITAPPIRWLLADRDKRRAALVYWIADPIAGAYFYLIHGMMRALPTDACSWTGAALTRLTRKFYKESDVRARRIWQRCHPAQADTASTNAAIDRLWRNVGRTMHEYSVIDRLWAEGRIAIEGLEHMHAARARGQPIIVTPVHLGNWEVVLVAGIANGYHGTGIYLPPENRFLHRLVNSVRARYGARFIAAGPNSLREAYRELRAGGGPFIIYIDELLRDRVNAPAFGRALNPASNIFYAVQLAERSGAALIPAYCERLGDAARFRVTFLPALTMSSTPDKSVRIRENAGKLNTTIEPIVRAHIDQWFFALDFADD